MSLEIYEAKAMAKIKEFDVTHTHRIFRTREMIELVVAVKDIVYLLPEEDAKESFNLFCIDLLYEYLRILKEANRITDEVYTETWNSVPHILFMYAAEINTVSDINKTMVRFLVFIASGYQGQDPRITCAPEKMKDLFDNCKEILRLLCDTSTERILRERLKAFAFQDTVESASNGNRNAVKYNATVELLERIGSDDRYSLLDERYKEGKPYETSEFGDIIPASYGIEKLESPREPQEEPIRSRKPRKLK